MAKLPLKKTVRYSYPANIKLTPEIGEGLELLDRMGYDIGELKRIAITERVKKEIKKINNRAS